MFPYYMAPYLIFIPLNISAQASPTLLAPTPNPRFSIVLLSRSHSVTIHSPSLLSYGCRLRDLGGCAWTLMVAGPEPPTHLSGSPVHCVADPKTLRLPGHHCFHGRNPGGRGNAVMPRPTGLEDATDRTWCSKDLGPHVGVLE